MKLKGRIYEHKLMAAYALASAFFVALTAIFGKIGVNEINSNLATLISTVIILIMLAGIV